MRIAWGVMGYGRGHAMRTLSVLPALQQQHQITVFAGGDAYDVLSPLFDTVRIPTLGYRYNRHGEQSLGKTVIENIAPMYDLLCGGAGRTLMQREFKARGIQVVISDSEAWTHRTAQALNIPRISFDHIGVIAYCKPHFPPDLWLAGTRDAAAYRAAMGIPPQILISSFYPAEASYPNVEMVGPMLRDAVLAARPQSGDYLLAYFNKGQHQYTPAMDAMLREIDAPVRIYGTGQSGESENLHFCPPAHQQFVDDLAGARAVLSTAGNQLIGECMHLGKPLLALPEYTFEQRLNAYLIERMGIGARAPLNGVTPSDVDRFLADADRYAIRMRDYATNGREPAIAALERMLANAVPRLGVSRSYSTPVHNHSRTAWGHAA